MCSLSNTYRVVHLATRFTHNGVSFSHSVDVDDAFGKQITESDVGNILMLWCQEHHAGRDGREIPLSIDGRIEVLHIPEAVD